MFKDHHYLSGDINKAARCYVAVWDNEIVGFSATLALPNGNFKNGWRGHRTVIFFMLNGEFQETIATSGVV